MSTGDMMIMFIMGVAFGGVCGVFAMSLLAAGRHADDEAIRIATIEAQSAYINTPASAKPTEVPTQIIESDEMTGSM